MKVLITGASSGIGRDMARYLSEKGFELVLTGRNMKKLEELKKTLKSDAELIYSDLSEENAPFVLYKKCKDKNIDFLINNAGYGLFGEFDKTDIYDECQYTCYAHTYQAFSQRLQTQELRNNFKCGVQRRIYDRSFNVIILRF